MSNPEKTIESTLKTIESTLKIVDEIVEIIETSTSLPYVIQFWGGFEEWLKFELVAKLCQKYDRKPWCQTGKNSQRWFEHTIGVEYTVTLTGIRRKKRVDLWVTREGSDDATKTHYVELKLAFRNAHESKMVDQWRADFRDLRTIGEKGGPRGRTEQYPYQAASILVGVGFDSEDGWKKLTETETCDGDQLQQDSALCWRDKRQTSGNATGQDRSGKALTSPPEQGEGRIRIAALHHTF